MSFLPKKSTLSRTLKRTYVRFLKLRGNPQQISLGFALGSLISVMPFFGFQIASSVLLAALFKWSKIASAMATWISNPFTFPFIYSLTYFVGAKLIGYEKPFGFPDDAGLSFFSKMLHKGPEIFISLTVGGVVVGLPLAVVSYYLAYVIIRRYQERIKEKVARQREKFMSKRIKEQYIKSDTLDKEPLTQERS